MCVGNTSCSMLISDRIVIAIRGKSGLKIADSETNLRSNSYVGICSILRGIFAV